MEFLSKESDEKTKISNEHIDACKQISTLIWTDDRGNMNEKRGAPFALASSCHNSRQMTGDKSSNCPVR